jgi:hypothetical protein
MRPDTEDQCHRQRHRAADDDGRRADDRPTTGRATEVSRPCAALPAAHSPTPARHLVERRLDQRDIHRGTDHKHAVWAGFHRLSARDQGGQRRVGAVGQ